MEQLGQQLNSLNIAKGNAAGAGTNTAALSFCWEYTTYIQQPQKNGQAPLYKQ
jgi:hypothetical protein